MNGYHPVRTGDWCFGKESVVKAIEAIGRGELVIVVDDESRENEGDLIMVGPQVFFYVSASFFFMHISILLHGSKTKCAYKGSVMMLGT
jgi:hypothetical protein